jgi:hypothetical protein
MYTHTHIDTHTHVHMYIYTHIHIYMGIYTYVHISTPHTHPYTCVPQEQPRPGCGGGSIARPQYTGA